MGVRNGGVAMRVQRDWAVEMGSREVGDREMGVSEVGVRGRGVKVWG